MLNDRSLAERYPLMDKYTSPVRRAEREIVGREREMMRLMAAMSRPELCNAILLAEAGSGKALDDMTPIPTPYGMTAIKNLSPGDKVFDERGRVCTVLGVYPQGLKPAFRVCFEDGGSETCCDEHLWDVRTSACADACAPYVTRRLGDVRRMLTHDAIYIPAAGPAEHAEADLPVPPYAAGVLLAAAVHGADGMDVWFSACGDEWVLRRICDLLGFTGWSSEAAGRKFYFLNADGTRAVRPGEILARIGTGATSGGMAVETYLTGSVRQRTEFLRGFMDARGLLLDEDGALSVRFMAADEASCGMVRRLAASLGIRTYEIPSGDADSHYVGFRPRGGTASARLDWFSGMFGSPNRTGRVAEVLARRHGACAGDARNYGDIRITGIEDLHEERFMTCIYVDSPRHLFLAGTGYHVTHNTALVQGTMLRDRDRDYLEVDLAKMVTACTTDANEMAALLKGLFDEVSEYCKSAGREAVLFIDEFHQIVQLSDAAVEALKPLLADSGTRGIRVIAATTYIEFRKYVAPNQPLVERLQRINLPEPGHDVVISILKGMAERYDVAREIRNPGLYELIYEYTNRYIPANAQPRKSILVMDAMIGWHRAMNRRFDDRLLADVIYDSEGVNVNFNVDASRIKAELDKRVLSQKFATTMIEQRLQICAADLNNKSRPMSSFLFTGSSGTGKELANSTLIPVFSPDGSVFFKCNGDLVPGDFVFNRKGEPVRVLGVFPQGRKPVYEVELTDGRVLPAGARHLWQYKCRYGNGAKHWRVADTETLMDKMARSRSVRCGRHVSDVRFVIPMNQAVQWSEADLPVDPYVLGVFIGNGSLRKKPLSLSSDDRFVVDEVALRIGASGIYKDPSSYTWTFYLPEGSGSGRTKKFYTADVFTGAAAGLVGLYSHEKFIPAEYRHASVEQRWALVRGLFDTDGHIGSNSRYNVSYSSTSRQLVLDIQQVLYSLGVSSRISNHGVRKGRTGNVHVEWHLHVMVGNQDKFRFFSLPRKLALCDEAVRFESSKQRVKKFHETVGIRDIRKTDRFEEMTCIYVDDEEHLYQAGDFIVTHNTEVTKSLANLLFGSDDAMIRMDMTEFANSDSLERFRRELTNRVWARPFSIILLDEIEKACSEVTRLLLQVLDDGRLMDENNRVVVFTNAYIVMTTNAGSEVYKNIAQYNADDEGSGKDIMKYYKVIRESIASTTGDNKFPPELLGRIDVIVPFQPLSEATMKDIATMNLKKLIRKIKDRHGVSVEVHQDVVRYLVEDNLDTDADSGGARVVISKMESEVTIPIARYINEHPGVRRILVGIQGKLVRDDKSVRVSDAHVKVWAPEQDGPGGRQGQQLPQRTGR